MIIRGELGRNRKGMKVRVRSGKHFGQFRGLAVLDEFNYPLHVLEALPLGVVNYVVVVQAAVNASRNEAVLLGSGAIHSLSQQRNHYFRYFLRVTRQQVFIITSGE